MDQMRAGQACHRFPGSFFNIIHAPLQQKSPCSPKGTGTENTLSAVPPCLLIKISRLITVPTHRLPVNAGIASEDTLGDPISPCPQRPICCPAFRSALSYAELSVDAPCSFTSASMVSVIRLCLLYNNCVRLSRTIFHHRRTGVPWLSLWESWQPLG